MVDRTRNPQHARGIRARAVGAEALQQRNDAQLRRFVPRFQRFAFAHVCQAEEPDHIRALPRHHNGGALRQRLSIYLGKVVFRDLLRHGKALAVAIQVGVAGGQAAEVIGIAPKVPAVPVVGVIFPAAAEIPRKGAECVFHSDAQALLKKLFLRVICRHHLRDVLRLVPVFTGFQALFQRRAFFLQAVHLVLCRCPCGQFLLTHGNFLLAPLDAEEKPLLLQNVLRAKAVVAFADGGADAFLPRDELFSFRAVLLQPEGPDDFRIGNLRRRWIICAVQVVQFPCYAPHARRTGFGESVPHHHKADAALRRFALSPCADVVHKSMQIGVFPRLYGRVCRVVFSVCLCQKSAAVDFNRGNRAARCFVCVHFLLPSRGSVLVKER